MRIGLIADIHANLPALQAVLADLQARQVDMIWNMGDYLGYGPNPEEVVQVNRQAYILSILGNYDQKVIKLEKTGKIKTRNPIKRFAFQWALDQLSTASLSYLKSLPKSLCLRIWDWNIMLVHGSPESNKEHITALTPKERLLEFVDQYHANIFICGHSHQALTREIENIWFINPGSVGRQDDGDYRASYALLDLMPDNLQVEHYRLDYDVKEVVREISRKNLPGEFSRMLQEGKNLEAIQHG
jgi:putative phosphoesterase